MNVMYAKNPAPENGQLQTLEVAPDMVPDATSLLRSNPNELMDIKKTQQNFMKVGAPALSVVAGQMGAAQIRRLGMGFVGTNPNVRKATDIAIPFLLSAFMLGSKNDYIKMAAVGAGVDFVHTTIKHLAPMVTGNVQAAIVDGDPDLADFRRARRPEGSGFLDDRSKVKMLNPSTSLGKASGQGSGYLHERPVTFVV